MQKRCEAVVVKAFTSKVHPRSTASVGPRQFVVIRIAAGVKNGSGRRRGRRGSDDDDRVDVVVQTRADVKHLAQRRCFAGVLVSQILLHRKTKKMAFRVFDVGQKLCATPFHLRRDRQKLILAESEIGVDAAGKVKRDQGQGTEDPRKQAGGSKRGEARGELPVIIESLPDFRYRPPAL